MRLPNKVTPYTNSIIALFPDILGTLKRRDISPKELFELTTSGKKDMGDFLSALDCLFALGKIELTEEGRMLRYVGRNSM
ncbi:ABC-three component system middle component 7 [Alkalihalobacterium bogoriense]|uniref:ABC-three component system middle component 7 n=1 Tax=Alkalihalobacterium bogoriense TaxID=246272 RepID=UPI000478762E|nr:ABC-three component system middle component 7 [Alkalihalobacterium bogoriense]